MILFGHLFINANEFGIDPDLFSRWFCVPQGSSRLPVQP